MLNRKILALVLPAVAVSALVGSGFSAWYFYDSGAYNTDNINVSVSVENKVEEDIGSLVLNSEIRNIKLVLDQGGYQNRATPTKGISFVNSETGSATVENIGANFTFTNDTVFSNLSAANLEVQVTTKVVFSTILFDYLTLKGLAGDNYSSVIDAEAGTTTYTGTINVSTASGFSETIELMNGSGDCSFFEYKFKPQDSGTYDTMVTDLNDATITFNWSAAVVVKASN